MCAQKVRIRIARQIGSGLAASFPEFTLTPDGEDTILCGCLPDQSALHGALARIRDLGLTLIAVEVHAEDIPNDHDHTL